MVTQQSKSVISSLSIVQVKIMNMFSTMFYKHALKMF